MVRPAFEIWLPRRRESIARRELGSFQRRLFLWRKNPRTGEETLLAPIVEREHAAASWHHVEDQLRVFPGGELRAGNIDRDAVDLAKLHVAQLMVLVGLKPIDRI